MEIEFNTRKKLQAFQSQLSLLLLSDFPHPSSESALRLIKVFFDQQLSRLERAAKSSDRNLIIQTCITINERIYQHLPILGFLLRSTNIRNNFEAYYAFVDMARALVGTNAEVIMSSEWDFSPLTYPMTVSVLPEHVLIGMPSFESSNALTLPLAGHELGHSVWRSEKLENKWAPEVRKYAKEWLKAHWPTFQQAFPEHASLRPTDSELSNNMFIVHVQSDIAGLSLNQIEELFCDATGIHLFGASYAHAFHYLLAPSLGGNRSIYYPRLPTRAELLSKYGKIDLATLGFENYPTEFQDQQPDLAPRDDFVSSAADEIAKNMGQAMYAEAAQIVHTKASRFVPDTDTEILILRMFEYGIPCQSPRSLADILNASWAYVRKNATIFNENERPLFEWVSELALKSVEVLEYRSRIGDA